MDEFAIPFKSLGIFWLAVGLVLIGWGSGALLAPSADLLVPLNSPLYLHGWAEAIALIGGVYAILLGVGLIRIQLWSQPLATGTHGLLALYSGFLLLAAPEKSSWLLWTSLLAINAGIAIFLAGTRARETFAYSLLRTAPVVPLRCEFCGSVLDPETGRCPKCDHVEQVTFETAPPLKEARLISLDDGTEYPISPHHPVRIGREVQGNDINLLNPTVSRRHAEIVYKAGQFVLIALQDTNGTYVNNRLVRRQILQDGDEIRFGRARFRFTIESS